MGAADNVEWILTNAVVAVQLFYSMGNIMKNAINNRPITELDTTEPLIDCLMAALSLLAFMGANSARRVLIVFTCLVVYLVTFSELQFTVAVFHKHYTSQALACSRTEMAKSADGCFYTNVIVILLVLLKFMITLFASMLCTFRLLAPSTKSKEQSTEQNETILVRHTHQPINTMISDV